MSVATVQLTYKVTIARVKLTRNSRVHAKLLAVEYPTESNENHKLLAW